MRSTIAFTETASFYPHLTAYLQRMLKLLTLSVED